MRCVIKILCGLMFYFFWQISAIPIFAKEKQFDWIAHSNHQEQAISLPDAAETAKLNQQAAKNFTRHENKKVAFLAAGLFLLVIFTLWRWQLITAENLILWFIAALIVVAIFSALYKALNPSLFTPILIFSVMSFLAFLKSQRTDSDESNGFWEDFFDSFFDSDSDSDSGDGGDGGD